MDTPRGSADAIREAAIVGLAAEVPFPKPVFELGERVYLLEETWTRDDGDSERKWNYVTISPVTVEGFMLRQEDSEWVYRASGYRFVRKDRLFGCLDVALTAALSLMQKLR